MNMIEEKTGEEKMLKEGDENGEMEIEVHSLELRRN